MKEIQNLVSNSQPVYIPSGQDLIRNRELFLLFDSNILRQIEMLLASLTVKGE